MRAGRVDLTPVRFLDRWVEWEYERGEERRIRMWLKMSTLPPGKTLDSLVQTPTAGPQCTTGIVAHTHDQTRSALSGVRATAREMRLAASCHVGGSFREPESVVLFTAGASVCWAGLQENPISIGVIVA